MPEITRTASTYDADAVGIGIVHLGLGAFHRAHQAVYVERWLNRHQGGPWGICAANIRSNRELPLQLTAGRNRYHVAAFSNRDRVEITDVRSIRAALFAGDDKSELLDRMSDPETRIVTLTVTEKAYHLNPASGELLLDNAGIAHDLAHPSNPSTAPGLIVEALRRRFASGLAPFTVLSCDNMPHNGPRTRNAVLTLAAAQAETTVSGSLSPNAKARAAVPIPQDTGAAGQTAPFVDWIANEVSFPATMVDRIVPAMTAAKADELEDLIGEPDPAAVACEAFSQWVIEDRFCAGRPDWERDGVEMVADIEPHETMKLRMLNGAHSLLAYVGLMRGLTTVAEAIADASLRALVEEFFDEAAATLKPAPGIDPERYALALLERFANDALEHRLSQIAMDGSQKIPQRWLAAALINLESGASIRATATGVAAWLHHVRGQDDNGNSWAVDDPLAASLRACHEGTADIATKLARLLGTAEVFPPELADSDRFRSAVLAAAGS